MYNPNDLSTYVFVGVIRNWYSRKTILDELYGHIHTLEQALGIDAAEHEAAFVKSFGALGAGADAHGGEGMVNGGEEAKTGGFLRSLF